MTLSSKVAYDTLVSPIVTEKSTDAISHNKYTFKISARATKTSVKKSVESIYDVNVVSVNTVRLPGKRKRFRGVQGKRSDIRKAIVTLRDGQSINFDGGI